MAQETFLNYQRYRYFWMSLLLLAICVLFYVCDDPIGGRNGGTVLGYTLGGLAALGIFYLMWFGIRKRSYYAKSTTLKGCLAAHVWLGVVLLFLVPLHSGFSFGWNVHTLAYVLMVLTIFTGIWGAMNYFTLPPQVGSHRGAGTLKQLLEQIQLISNDLDQLSMGKSDSFLKLLQKINFEHKPSLRRSLFGKQIEPMDQERAASLLLDLPDSEKEQGLQLVSVVNKKRELCAQLQQEVATLSWLKLWLYFHVPVSFALVAALIIHIISVFFYW